MKQPFPPDTPYDDHEGELTFAEAKQLAHAARDLAVQIVGLSARQLRHIPLEGELQEAVALARRLTHRGALARQLNFIGKILRAMDQAPLLQGLQDAQSSRAYLTPTQTLAREWAERLAQGAEAIGDFLAVAPAAERTRLSQLLRQHAKNRLANKADNGALLAYVESQLSA